MKGIIGGTFGALAVGGALLLAGCREPSAAASGQAASGPTLVNCGQGRQALVRPLAVGSESMAQVECVPVAPAAAFARTVSYAPRSSTLPATEDVSGRASERTTYGDRPTYTRATYERPRATRSWKKSALIIGGSAAGGAGIGAIIDGGTGAKKGAVIGGVGGAVYDLATRNKNP